MAQAVGDEENVVAIFGLQQGREVLIAGVEVDNARGNVDDVGRVVAVILNKVGRHIAYTTIGKKAVDIVIYFDE